MESVRSVARAWPRARRRRRKCVAVGGARVLGGGGGHARALGACSRTVVGCVGWRGGRGARKGRCSLRVRVACDGMWEGARHM